MIDTRRGIGSGGDQADRQRSADDTRPAGRGPSVDRILDRVSREVGDDGFSRYFRHQTRLRYIDGKLDVTVPTGFVAELINRKFGLSLVRAAKAELDPAEAERDIELRFSVDRSAFGGPTAETAVAQPARPVEHHAAPPRPTTRHDAHTVRTPTLRYRLEDFIVGDSNRLAFTAAQRIAQTDCPRSFSPLFIHGACGLGKTHLLQGIAQHAREAGGGRAVVYTTAEAFTNEYINALRASRLEAFRRSYRAVKLLCIDDVQFFSNKQATQSELLHTFDAIDLEGARIVLASDEHPRAVRKFSSALVSRFMAGMVVRLDAPEPALRQRIVLHIALNRGLRLEPAAAALIASRCTPPGQASSVRDLEGSLTRIEAVLRVNPELTAASQSGEIGLVLVRRALGADTAAPISGPRRPIRAEQILEEVCRTLRVDHGEIVGKGRHKRVVLARSITAHLCRGLTTLSFPEIARAMGRPNHSTVVTACNRIQQQLAADAALDLGAEHLTELEGLNLRGLIDQVRESLVRSAPGA